MGNAIRLSFNKEGVLRFQNIYKLSDFLASEVKNLETAHFKYKVHIKKYKFLYSYARYIDFYSYHENIFSIEILNIFIVWT